MKRQFDTLNIVTTAMLTSVAVILARAFHHMGGMEVSTLFSPMHFPILLLGILCGWALGGIGGLLTPLVSFAISGMPPFPNGLVPMAVELCLYGVMSGLLRNVFLNNPKSNNIATVLALALAMIIGRAVNALVGAILLTATTQVQFGITLWTRFLQNFASTWLGIVLQLVLIPVILIVLQKTNVLSKYLTDDQIEGFLTKNGDQ